MLLMNLGSRYIINELPDEMEEILNNTWVRRIVIFSIVFIAIRDIKASILLTLVFIIVCKYFLDKNSRFYLGDNKAIRTEKFVSKQEAMMALQTLQKYKKQKKVNKVKK